MMMTCMLDPTVWNPSKHATTTHDYMTWHDVTWLHHFIMSGRPQRFTETVHCHFIETVQFSRLIVWDLNMFPPIKPAAVQMVSSVKSLYWRLWIQNMQYILKCAKYCSYLNRQFCLYFAAPNIMSHNYMGLCTLPTSYRSPVDINCDRL